MTLEDWYNNGWLKRHQTSVEEIRDLLLLVDRDLRDSSVAEVSSDWRFGIAYNAALKLCTVLLAASGFRAARDLQHYRTIQAMELILGQERRSDVAYLDVCRKKRNIVEYEEAGLTTDAEADELIAFVREFRQEVRAWLSKHHQHLLE